MQYVVLIWISRLAVGDIFRTTEEICVWIWY
jgi:hypothetical protein